jgi:hypothetical protein
MPLERYSLDSLESWEVSTEHLVRYLFVLV